MPWRYLLCQRKSAESYPVKIKSYLPKREPAAHLITSKLPFASKRNKMKQAAPYILQVFLQIFNLIQPLPGKIQIISAEMSVGCRLFIDRTS